MSALEPAESRPRYRPRRQNNPSEELLPPNGMSTRRARTQLEPERTCGCIVTRNGPGAHRHCWSSKQTRRRPTAGIGARRLWTRRIRRTEAPLRPSCDRTTARGMAFRSMALWAGCSGVRSASLRWRRRLDPPKALTRLADLKRYRLLDLLGVLVEGRSHQLAVRRATLFEIRVKDY